MVRKANRRGGMRLSPHDVHYLLLSLFCIILMGVSIKLPVLNHMFQNGVLAVGLPLVQASQSPAKATSELGGWLKDVSTVHESNKKLKSELASLQEELNNLKRVQFENEKLHELLDVVKELRGEPITTYVLVDPSSPFRRSVVVGAGAKDGVEKGQEVISGYGLVGRIVEVFEETSRVLLISDYVSRVPVKILETRERAILSGTNENNELILLFTEKGKFIRPHMTVVTSGDGEVFSEGLPVGMIESVGAEVRVRPDVDLTRIDQVSILRRPVKGVLKTEDLEKVSENKIKQGAK